MNASRSRIVVAGGTTEARRLADELLRRGYHVTLSRWSSTPDEFDPPIVDRPLALRHGALDCFGWERLLKESEAKAVIDAAHPYATRLREDLRRAAANAGVPLFRLARPCTKLETGAVTAQDHEKAARLACTDSRAILVTIGSRALGTYVNCARQYGVELYARLLDHASSREVAKRLGLDVAHATFGIGPFSVEQNITLLVRTQADVLVTKDGGIEGGVPDKLAACRTLGRRAVVVARPAEPANAYVSMSALLEALDRGRS